MARKAKGQSLIEFAITATVLIPVALLFVDACLIVCGLQLNDRACSEAARLAAIGNPTMAVARAQQIISTTLRDKHSPFSLRLLAAETSVKKSQLEGLYPYGGQVSGVVKVTTEVTVRPLILSWFLGGGSTSLRFQSKEQFPCTYIMPNVLEHTSL